MPQTVDTLFPTVDPPSNPEAIDPIVIDFLRLYQEYNETYYDKLREREDLENERDTVANTDDPRNSNKRTNPSMAFKLTNHVMKQVDIPSFNLICGGMSEAERIITQSLFEDALEKAGWRRVLAGKKNGAMREYISVGNAIVGFGTNNGEKFPFTYCNVDFTRCAVNIDANEFVNPGGERSTRKFMMMKEYQTSQVLAMFPELKGKIVEGALPTVNQDGTFDNKQTEMQKQVALQHRTQIGYGYDIDYTHEDGKKGLFVVFAGGNCYKFKDLRGKLFPFLDRDGNATIPYGMLTAFARQRGFVDYGVLQVVHKLGVMHSMLENMGITYTITNTNPIRIMSTSMSESEVSKQIAKANQRARDGKLPIMVNKDGKEFGGMSTLQTNPIIGEVNSMLVLMEKDLAQMGFNLNDIATDTTKTLGALQLEVAAATSSIRYLQRENSGEYERLLQMFIQALKERKKDDSDIFLVPNVDAYRVKNADGRNVKVPGVPMVDEQGNAVLDRQGNPKAARNWTLEDLKEMLRQYEEVDVEVVGGVQNNPVLEDANDRDIIASSDPTSRASLMTRAARARRMGRNLEPEDFMPGSGQPQQPQAPQPQPTQPQNALIV